MAKNINGKNWGGVTVSWDGWHYPESSHIPSMTAPSGLSVTPSGTTNTISWTNGTPSAQTRVWRANTENGTYSIIATKNAGVTSHNDTSLPNGTYWYKVSHIVGNYPSDLTSGVSGTISSGGGSLADGSTVSVTVPGAGSNVSPSNQEFLGGSWGPVEGAAAGALFNTFMPANWAMPGGTGTRVSTVMALNGSKSLLHDRSLGYQFAIRYDMGSEQGVAIVRWSYFLLNPNDTTHQLKQVRFVGSLIGGSGGYGDGDISNVYFTSSTSNSERATEQFNINNSAGNVGVTSVATGFQSGSFGTWFGQGFWVTNEAIVIRNSNSATSDGYAKIISRRADTGEIIGTYTIPNRNFTSTDAFLRYIVWQGYMGNPPAGVSLSPLRLYLDRDFYIIWSGDRTVVPKTIKVGNASTFAACTTLIDQEFISWTQNGSDADIQFRFNQGRLASPSGYVYVMSNLDTPVNTNGVALS